MKRILFILLLASLTGSLFAESAVWKVSNGDHVLYLAGSIHTLRSTDYPLPTEFEKAFDASQKIIFETDMSLISSPDIMPEILQKSVLPQGTTLQSLLSEKTYAKLENLCNTQGIPMQAVQQMKPILLINTLELSKMQQLGFDLSGVDNYYFAQVAEQHTEWSYFEPVEFQIELLTSMGDGYENEFVEYSLSDMDHIEKDVNSIIKEWRLGETHNLSKMLQKEQKKFPSVYNSMYKNRNAKWLPQIEDMLLDDTTEMIIVGFAHLAGKDGLLQQLQKKGYRIEQVH